MNYRARRTAIISLLGCLANALAVAQNDGDHPVTDPVSNITFLAPDAQINLGLTQPTGFTVGTAPSPNAALVVDGAQLGHLNTLWTHAFQPIQNTTDFQRWQMNKSTPLLLNAGVGRLFSRGGADYTFNIDAMSGDLRLFTNEIPRAALFYRQADRTINGATFNQSGYFALAGRQQFFNWTTASGSLGPFSRFHLVDGTGSNNPAIYQPTLGFRGWHRNGITITGNSDHMYFGHKYGVSDGQSQAVLQWSEGTLDANRQSLSFRFATTPGGGGGAESDEGLEVMRLWPESNTSGYVGIGDFVGAAQNPSERLDLLDGTIRLRNFTDNTYLTYTYDRVLVVNPSDGRVHWRPANTLGIGDCEWTLQGSAGTNSDVATAYPGNTGCPQEDRAVGIGIQQPAYKLDVDHSDEYYQRPGGLRVRVKTDSQGWRYGIDSHVQPMDGGTELKLAAGIQSILKNVGRSGAADSDGYAVFARHTTDQDLLVRSTHGVYGDAVAEAGTVTLAHGGFFSARVTDDGNVSRNYGVYGSATGGTSNFSVFGAYPGAGANDWAGYFDHDVNINGDVYLYSVYAMSDATLKTDVQDIAPSADVVQALQVHSYNFTEEAITNLALPEGQQVGLIAQELEQVLPGLVQEKSVPAEYDSTGTMTQPGATYKAVNYVGMIPYLISAVQKLAADNALMQQQLAACCTANPTDDGARMVQGTSDGIDVEKLTPAQERMLRIAPNPFTDRTTLFCTLERAGRMQLLANSADGRSLLVLSAGQREAGEFQYEWSTENLAPGVYYITLLLDGEPVVKRAVKVGR
ncbi:MAG: tail fiber domain-containing protein [Flavobacteriales bacterium]|nr:tail fiber domain-containing protein [Flavobacteriales bacterium]